MTTLFSVEGNLAAPAAVASLTSLGLHERAHLQEWVLANPSVLGDDVMVITAEYDRWSGVDGTRARDRLDVLGLDVSGRLVVAELKRADSGGDVHLQAITYAALVSRFTLETLADALAQHRSRRGQPTTTAAAVDLIREHAGGDVDPDLLARPRLVLVAASFPRQVTHTAVWLSEVGLDIDLVEVDLAAVIGTAAQPLGQHVTRCADCTTAYRILNTDGRPAANFAWSDPDRTDTVEEVLTAEGVRFTGGVADPAQRLVPDQLRALSAP